MEQSVSSVRRALVNAIEKTKALFPHHQIFFRTDGKVRFFTLTTSMQLAGVAAIGCALIWTGMSTYNFIARGDRLEKKDAALSAMSGEFEALNENLESLEARILAKAAQLEARQTLLQNVLLDGLVEPEKLEVQPLEIDGLSVDGAPTDAEALKGAFLLHEKQPGESTTAYLNSVFSILERRQIAFANAMKESAAAEKDAIITLLANLNVDADTFLGEALDGTPGTNVGGPFVALSDKDKDAPGAQADPFKGLIDEWSLLKDLRDETRSIPAISPVKKFYVSSKYGNRRDPFSKRWAHHSGVDLAAWYGTPVQATTDGLVTYAGYKAGYGRVVEVDHGNGFVTRYGHLRKVVAKKGQSVTMGDKLGETGSTGRSTGPHVHYEIWFDGKTVNPLNFIKASEDVLKIQGRNARG